MAQRPKYILPPPSDTPPETHDLIWDDQLVIRWMPGTGKRLVVSFTGVERKYGGEPSREFGHVASHRGRNHVAFVTDMTRGYFSAPGMRARIADCLQALIAREGLSDVRSIGNSMGGTGAILLAQDLPLVAVASFVPAMSLSPAMTAFRVWDEYQDILGPERAESLVPILQGRPQTQFYLCYSDGTGDDRRQLRLVPDLPNVHLWVYRGERHRVTSRMKDDGTLSNVAHAMLNDDLPTLTNLMATMPPVIRLAGGAGYQRNPDFMPAEALEEDEDDV